MPDAPIKVGIVGAGYTAREHAKAFADVPGVQVVGIHSRTRSKAEALARDLRIPAVYDSIGELHFRARADIVVAAVVELSMKAVSRACFEHPWTVLLEKPAGFNLAEAEEIAAAAQGRKAPVLVGLNRRQLSSTEGVRGGLLRENGPRYIRVQDQQDPEAARLAGQPESVVRNWMFANSIHTIDYFRWFGRGAIRRVENLRPWNPQAPGIVVARIEFDSGDWGLYEAVWNGPGPWAVAVTVGRRRWELRPLEKLTTQELGKPPVVVEPHPWDTQFKPGFRRQAQEAVLAARGKPNAATPVADALETMRLIARIYGV